LPRRRLAVRPVGRDRGAGRACELAGLAGAPRPGAGKVAAAVGRAPDVPVKPPRGSPDCSL